MILYAGGNFWDRKWFDPRYRPNSSWTKKSPALFPSPENLVRLRSATAGMLLPEQDRKDQIGVYTAAEELVRSERRWREVQGAVVISKFVRSFIWPILIGFLLLLTLTLVYFWVSIERAEVSAVLAACCLFVAASSFPAYSTFRVKHMEQLYQLAAHLKHRESQTVPPNNTLERTR